MSKKIIYVTQEAWPLVADETPIDIVPKGCIPVAIYSTGSISVCVDNLIELLHYNWITTKEVEDESDS